MVRGPSARQWAVRDERLDGLRLISRELHQVDPASHER